LNELKKLSDEKCDSLIKIYDQITFINHRWDFISW
jgi:hypothetical protein